LGFHSTASVSGALDSFFSHYYRRRPVNATFTGVHMYDDALPDWTAAGLEALDDEMHSLARELSAAHPAPSTARTYRDDAHALDAELARCFLETQLTESASTHGVRHNPALWTGEAIFSVISLMIRNFAELDERIENAAARLQAIPEFLRNAMTVIGDAGVPRYWTERAVRELAGAEILLTRGIDAWLESDVHSIGVAARLRIGAQRAREAFSVFSQWLRSCRVAPDSALACGAAMYDVLLARGHHCSRNRSDLLAEARNRFAEERARLDVMAKPIAGSWQAAQESLASRAPSAEDFLGAFGRIWEECRSGITSRDGVTWPDWPIQYVPIPTWTADAAPYLYYLFYRSPAPLDPYSIYDYVVPNVPREGEREFLRAWNTSVIRLNHVVHHGGVGHHVQNWHAYHRARSRCGKIAAVDCASRIGMFSGGSMAEGWACYSTCLASEFGLLSPLEQLAEQHSRVRFLARTIVDIELHQGTMSFAEAAEFYTKMVGLSEPAARGEVVKNSMFPCTAVMYWLGLQSILDLRDAIQAKRGSSFSLKGFHDELLGLGSIPVPLAARIMSLDD
jgi:hypothetical protein